MSRKNTFDNILNSDYKNEFVNYNELLNAGIFTKDQIKALIIMKKNNNINIDSIEKNKLNEYIKKLKFKDLVEQPVKVKVNVLEEEEVNVLEEEKVEVKVNVLEEEEKVEVKVNVLEEEKEEVKEEVKVNVLEDNSDTLSIQQEQLIDFYINNIKVVDTYNDKLTCKAVYSDSNDKKYQIKYVN
jgi:hypothetical protein